MIVLCPTDRHGEPLDFGQTVVADVGHRVMKGVVVGLMAEVGTREAWVHLMPTGGVEQWDECIAKAKDCEIVQPGKETP